MSDLKIPDRARALMLRAAWPLADDITNGQHLAARIIVAAELRALADEITEFSWPVSLSASSRAAMAAILRKRADDLDPPGGDALTDRALAKAHSDAAAALDPLCNLCGHRRRAHSINRGTCSGSQECVCIWYDGGVR